MALAEFTLLQVALSLKGRVALPTGYNPGGSANSNRTVSIDGWGIARSYDYAATPSPAPTTLITRDVTIGGGGTTDIDLSTAPIVGAVDGDGEPYDREDLTTGGTKKLLACFFSTHRTTGTNAALVTIKPHGTDGYPLWGSGNEVDLLPNAAICMECTNSGNQAVNSTNKVIQFAGTAADKIRVILVFQG